MKNIKPLIAAVIVLILICGIPITEVKAETLEYSMTNVREDINYNNRHTLSGTAPDHQEIFGGYGTILQGFYNENPTFNLSKIEIAIETEAAANGDWWVEIYRYDGAAATSTTDDLTQTDFTFVASSTNVVNYADITAATDHYFDNDEWETFNFNLTEIENGETYLFRPATNQSSGSILLNWFGRMGSSSYFQGVGMADAWWLSDDVNKVYWDPNSLGGSDTAFKIYSELLHSDEVALVYPVSQSGINFDFSNWNVSFDTATSTTATSTDFYTIQIYSGATSTAITDLSGGAVVYQSESPRNIENTRLFGVNTQYYTQLELRYFEDIYQTYGDLVATSSITSFITGSGSETDLGYYPAPTSTATSSEWTFTCDPESGFFVNSLCNLFRFLFVPTPASLERFSEIGDLVENKPPFGYWNEIKGEIQNISTSTASFTLTGSDTLSENEVFGVIRTTIVAILWVLFAFWILHRIRTFDFHL